MHAERFEMALPEITKAFDELEERIFTRTDIDKLFAENRELWGLSKKTSIKSFIEFLVEADELVEAEFNFPSRKEARYFREEVSMFELAQSLKPNAYLTHYGAMYLHRLTDQFPETIYLNQEQPRHHERIGGLTQDGIDRAFQNRPRMSNEIAEYEGTRVCVVHGQRTGGLGVINIDGENGETLRVTDVERTLIDITVRPAYAGGAEKVLEAYRLAREEISIKKLVTILKKMNYVYPYHQAVGFYLDRAGVYKKAELRQLQSIPMEFDFYLEHKMADAEYSEEWRIYFPADL